MSLLKAFKCIEFIYCGAMGFRVNPKNIMICKIYIYIWSREWWTHEES